MSLGSGMCWISVRHREKGVVRCRLAPLFMILALRSLAQNLTTDRPRRGFPRMASFVSPRATILTKPSRYKSAPRHPKFASPQKSIAFSSHPRSNCATSASFHKTARVVVNRTALCCWWRPMQYFNKGAANLCGVVEIINEDFSDEAIHKKVEDRLMPRTEELPLYTTHEFNDKVSHQGGAVEVDFYLVQLSIYFYISRLRSRLVLLFI